MPLRLAISLNKQTYKKIQSSGQCQLNNFLQILEAIVATGISRTRVVSSANSSICEGEGTVSSGLKKTHNDARLPKLSAESSKILPVLLPLLDRHDSEQVLQTVSSNKIMMTFTNEERYRVMDANVPGLSTEE